MTQKELVKNYLLSAGEPVTTKQIIEATGVNKGTLAGIMSFYSGNGEVEIVDDGHPSGRKLYCWSGKAKPAATPTATPVEVAAMNEQRSAKQKEEMREFLTNLGIIQSEGAYHGMVEPHPDDAPQIDEVGTQKIMIVDASAPIDFDSLVEPQLDNTPFNTIEHSIRDALRFAHTALDNYRRTRKDPIEDSLQQAVDALTLALSLDLNGGVK